MRMMFCIASLKTFFCFQILINAALGFDTFMVMRHGFRKSSGSEIQEPPVTTTTKSVRIPGEQLGCYYCNDVVAPGDVRSFVVIISLFTLSYWI